MNSKIQSLILSLTYFLGLEFLISKQSLFGFQDIFWVLFLLGVVILGEIFWFFFLPQLKSFNFPNFLKIIFLVLFITESAFFVLLFKNPFFQQGVLVLFGVFIYLIFWAFAQSTRLSLFAFNVFISMSVFLFFLTFVTLFTLFFSYKISLSLFHFLAFLVVLFFYLFLFSLHFEIKKSLIVNIWILVFLFLQLFLVLSFYPLNQFILSFILSIFFYVFWILSFYYFEKTIGRSVIIEVGILLGVVFFLILRFMPWFFYI